MKKKLLSVILVLCLVLGMVPAAYAANGEAVLVSTEQQLREAAAAGGDIKLTGNIDLTQVLVIDKSVNLDLNGCTIRQTGSTTMEWCNWYSCPVSMCPQDCDSNAHSRQAVSDAIHVLGSQSEKVSVNIYDNSTDKTGAVIAGEGANYAVTVYGTNLDLCIYGGTYSGGSTFCVYNSHRWSSPSWITLYGGTYENGVQVNTIHNGTFRQKPQSSGNTWVLSYDIYGGTCEAGTEAQMTEFYGGTFNGSAECFRLIEGGTFNGYLHLSRNVSSVSDCSINHSLEWNGDTMPTFTNVTIAEDITLWNRGYEVVDGEIQMIPRYTVLVTTADSAMGTVSTVSGSVKNPGSSTAITSSSLTGGGRKWEDAYRGAAVSITEATAQAKDGYTFVGWFDNAQGSSPALSSNTTLTYRSDENGLQNNLSFYAVFESDESYADKVEAANTWLGDDYENTTEFSIDSLEDMQSFTIAVNSLGKNFEGKTVKLTANLTYGENDSFTPIGNSGIAFKGIFDGQEHTISGLRYATANKTSAYVGLFGNVNSAEIRNLTLSGVNFSGGRMTGAFAGHADNTAFTNCKLIETSSLADAYFLGGIFGHGAALNTVIGCTVEDSTIDGYWKTGAVAGYICGANVTDTTIERVTFPGTGFTGSVIGHANDGDTQLENVTVSGVADNGQQKIYMVGTNYASGEDHTITITGNSTYADAAGILPSALGDNNVAVSGGSYTFAIPDEQLGDGKVSVTFKDGDEIVIVRVIGPGETAALPDAPEKDNHVFAGWYLEDGTTPVTADTTFSASAVAIAKWAKSAVALDQSNLTLFVGSTAQLTATVLSESTGGTDAVTWKSENPEIASVADDGTVTGVKAGTTTVTASVGEHSASCTVLVTDDSEVAPAVGESVPNVDDSIDSSDQAAALSIARSVQADSAIIGAAQDAADELNEDEDKKQNFVEQGKSKLGTDEGQTVSLYTLTYLAIEATDLTKDDDSKITSITLDITPMIQVVASTADNSAEVNIKTEENPDGNAVVVQNPKPLTIRTEANVTVQLPASFARETLYIKHEASSGKVYYYQAAADENGSLTFLSKHGFSPFTFSLNNDAVAEVGGIGYDSFEEAVNAAKNGETVIVRKESDFSADVTGSSRTITIRNETEAEIIVTLNGTELTIPANDSKNFTYTRSSSVSSEPSLGTPLPPVSEAEKPSAGSGFKSDTTNDLTVDGMYQFRITSLDGTTPVMTASSASFRVELASQEGNDYFFKIYAQGAPGSTAEISVNGTPLLTATVSGSVSGVISDTTHPFTVAEGGTYQFRLTASERPSFAAGSPSFTVEYAGQIGSDYFYKVHAIGKPGDGCGFYINRESSPVAVATIV